jgi:hypothetical protein
MNRFSLPEWAITAKLDSDVEVCEKCSGFQGIVFHTKGDCPFARKCVVCGKATGHSICNETIVMPYPSTHDGDAVCIACIDSWLSKAIP